MTPVELVEPRSQPRRAATPLAEAIHEIATLGGDRVLVAMLQHEQARIEHRTIDPAGAPLIAVKPMPAKPTMQPRGAVLVPLPQAPTFGDLTRPMALAPIEEGYLPDAWRDRRIPRAYATEYLSLVIPDHDHRLLLVYGGRYLVSAREDTAEVVFDLQALRDGGDVTFARHYGGTIYVCTGPSSLVALDGATGAIVWRIAERACDASFNIAHDFLVMGVGSGDAPAGLVVIDDYDGSVVQRIPLRIVPTHIGVQGDIIRVETETGPLGFQLTIARW